MSNFKIKHYFVCFCLEFLDVLVWHTSLYNSLKPSYFNIQPDTRTMIPGNCQIPLVNDRTPVHFEVQQGWYHRASKWTDILFIYKWNCSFQSTTSGSASIMLLSTILSSLQVKLFILKVIYKWNYSFWSMTRIILSSCFKVNRCSAHLQVEFDISHLFYVYTTKHYSHKQNSLRKMYIPTNNKIFVCLCIWRKFVPKPSKLLCQDKMYYQNRLCS